MADIIVKGCRFPDDLHYDVENHVWYRPMGGGVLRVGITTVGVALAREVLAFTPKRPGRRVEAGRSCATVESAKWVGVVRIAFDGEVTAMNAPMMDRPRIVNADPYGEGWLIEVRPDDPAMLEELVTGAEIETAYRAWMDAIDYPGCEA